MRPVGPSIIPVPFGGAAPKETEKLLLTLPEKLLAPKHKTITPAIEWIGSQLSAKLSSIPSKEIRDSLIAAYFLLAANAIKN